MSKTAQRKHSAYQEGFQYGRRGIRFRVNPRWKFAAEFREGWYAGRRARQNAELETFVLSTDQPEIPQGTLAAWASPIRLTKAKLTDM